MSDPADRLAPVPREQLEILRATGAPITVGATGLAAADLFVDALRGEHVQRLVGELHLADIGIPPSVFRRLAIPYRSPFSQGPVVRILLPRRQDSATR